MIQIQDLQFRISGKSILEDINLEIPDGVFAAIIGPNGAGKSTLINAISGVVPPSSGRVLINGQNTATMAVHAVPAAGLGRTFQNIRLFRNLSVLENVTVA
ncbi:MAG TPA: ATP-binding cassette domain-containing protein, partial [Candidatus Cloacimonadota bacterium]|nr:ATP-binding cassette domain-containing protein [Candidatus Cloacimonadota bacterium]